MDQLVHFSPTTITFEITPGRQTTTHLHLHNVSEHRIIYKVKTTHIKRYCVRPNAALIEPGAEIDVELTQQALKDIPEDVNSCRDRFLLQIARIDLVPSGNTGGKFRGHESVMDLWSAVPQEIMHKAKFNVNLRMADTPGEIDLNQETRTVSDSSAVPNPSTMMHAVLERNDIPSFPSSSASHTSPTSAILAVTPEAASESKRSLGNFLGVREERQRQAPSSMIKFPELNPSSIPRNNSSDLSAIKQISNARIQNEMSAEEHQEIDYTSVEYARERVIGIRTAQKLPAWSLDEPTRQRVAVERAGELVRTINVRQKEIDTVSRELSEARHRLSDARTATRPAYDVKYEVSDNFRVPYAQIAIMAIISGALLQLLV